MPKVSIIIPAYNAIAYLPKTIESVLQQTFTDFEVLIVNDGSSDNILQWADDIADARIQVISQSNQGVSTARNTGIAHAKGEYVAFLDADDLWDATKLEKQVSCLDNDHTIGLVYTWTLLIDQLGNPTGKSYIYYAEGDVWKQLVVRDFICNGSSPMVRRSCFEKAGLFDPNIAFGEDLDMWIRIAAHYRFALIKEILTYYRRHPKNATTNREKLMHGLRQVTEKTFKSSPLELLYLRNRKYGTMFHDEAWNCLLDERDYEQAMYLHRLAFLYYPQLVLNKNFVRLSLRILLVRLLGIQRYDGMRTMFGKVKQTA